MIDIRKGKLHTQYHNHICRSKIERAGFPRYQLKAEGTICDHMNSQEATEGSESSYDDGHFARFSLRRRDRDSTGHYRRHIDEED